MRALRTTLAAAVLLGAATRDLSAQSQQQVKQLLMIRPGQPGVEYDTPADAAADACRIEMAYNKDKKAIGWIIRDGQGQVVRKVIDANGKKDPATGKTRSDQWSYYKDGFEVYREVDLDDDGTIDEARWSNSGGTRTATIKNSKITGWTRLSAEEASKVLVQALANRDGALLMTVLATASDLKELGAPDALVEAATKAAADRNARYAALNAALAAAGWNDKTTWSRFDGQMPHVIPADAGADLKNDLVLYENAAVFAGAPGAQDNPLSLGYLQVPELVRVGEVWKFIDLPHFVDPKKPTPPPASLFTLRSAIYREGGGPQSLDPEYEIALKKLAEHDSKLAQVAGASPKQLAEFHYQRVKLAQEVAQHAPSADDRLTYDKEIVNSLAAAFQTGLYPEGGKVLEQLAAKGGKVGTYAAYRKIQAEYNVEADDLNANVLELQKKYLAKLDAFLKSHPDADEVPSVLYDLASGSEFNAAEDDARTYYERLAKDYPNSPAGKRAAGALRRLDLVGKPISLAGTAADGRKVDANSYRGKTLLIVFWSSEATQFRNDLERLNKLAQSNRDKGLELLGVNLDGSKEAMESFLRDNPAPWPQIHEDGGMDSRLADEFGILTTPLMFLVDAQGKVVSRSLRTPAEVERLLEKPVAGRAASLNLGSNR